MTSPAPDWFYIVIYVMFWAVRIQGCLRRGRQPRLRGREWFFGVHVQPGFYDGDGRRLLRAYWMRMLIPFAVDIPWAISIVAAGRYQQFAYLVLIVSALIHVNHQISVRIAERHALPFAEAESTRPAVRVALSLTPRRLRDYSSPAFEWMLAIASMAMAAWLARYYIVEPHARFRVVFGPLLLAFYVQAGLLILKRVLIGWRSAVPYETADAHLEMVEQRRRYYAAVCDWIRATVIGSALFWPFYLATPKPLDRQLSAAWLVLWLVISIVATVWAEIKRKQIVNLAIRARPAALPNLQQDSRPRWPFCYEPAAPTLVFKSARGYSLNLANRPAQYSAAYAAGLALLIFVLRMAP